MKVVQISDIHAEDGGMFRPDLMERVVEETNDEGPDLVAVAGDLTGAGYREQFEMAKGYLDRLECDNVVAVMGNHDARNVGHRYFEDLFGMRPAPRAAAAAVPPHISVRRRTSSSARFSSCSARSAPCWASWTAPCSGGAARPRS